MNNLEVGDRVIRTLAPCWISASSASNKFPFGPPDVGTVGIVSYVGARWCWVDFGARGSYCILGDESIARVPPDMELP